MRCTTPATDGASPPPCSTSCAAGAGAQDRQSSRAELEKRGVPIIERPRDSFSPRARVRRLGNGWGCIPLTQAKHAREACHAAYIEEHTGDIVFSASTCSAMSE